MSLLSRYAVARVPSGVVRRLLVVSATLAALTASSVALAGSASAEVPEGWDEPPAIDSLFVLGVLVGIPILLAVVIGVLVYLPAMIRGERVAPGAPSVEDQWLGGPRKTGGELAAPDTSDSQAGGASGRW